MQTRPSVLAAVLLLGALATPALGQQAEWKRWFVTIAGGPNRGEAASSMAAAMRSENWDDSYTLGFGDVSTHPWHHDGDFSSTVRIGYRPWRRVGVSYQRSTDALGYAGGYRGSSIGFGTWLGLEPAVRSNALLGSVWLTRGTGRLSARLDGGAALFEARVQGDGNESSRRVGALLGGGVGLRVWHIQLTLDAQRRYVGDMTYGDYDVGAVSGEQTFGEHEASFDHDVVLLGVGLTF